MNKKILVCIAFLLCCLMQAGAGVLQKSVDLVKAKKLSEAKKLLICEIKTNKTSYRAYIMLGCIYETEKDYKKAAACFLKAFKINPKLTSLKPKIKRLSYLCKKAVANNKNLSRAERLYNEAEEAYYSEQKETAFQKYTQAIELDRTLLSKSLNFAPEALEFYKKNANLSDKNTFYLGFYSFLLDLYPKALNYLRTYITLLPNDNRIAFAKQLIEECENIAEFERQKKSENEAALACGKSTPISFAAKSAEQKTIKSKAKPAQTLPNTQNDKGEPRVIRLNLPYSEALEYKQQRQRAISLINSFYLSGGVDQLKIIWQLGAMRRDFSETVEFLRECLQSSDNTVVTSALEAFAKLPQSALNSAVNELSAIIDNDDMPTAFGAIRILAKNQLMPELVMPRLVKLYAQAKKAEKSVIAQTAALYGKTGTAVLKQELLHSPLPEQVPISQLIKALNKRG